MYEKCILLLKLSICEKWFEIPVFREILTLTDFRYHRRLSLNEDMDFQIFESHCIFHFESPNNVSVLITFLVSTKDFSLISKFSTKVINLIKKAIVLTDTRLIKKKHFGIFHHYCTH